MSPRPSTDCAVCIYDEKKWRSGSAWNFLDTEDLIVSAIGSLYLASLLCGATELLGMVHGGCAPAVVVWGEGLDLDARSVIDNSRRFRHALSEHLAFWTRLAAARSSLQSSQWASTLPNLQPEDKGPDGLFASVGDDVELEVQEIKSSTGNPSSKIARAEFRQSGHVRMPSGGTKTGRLLEDLWLFENGVVGFLRLDKLTSDLCTSLGLTTTQYFRVGLASRCRYNAIVVAGRDYSSVELFEGYQHVTGEVGRRVATYIGSRQWGAFAEGIRNLVKRALQRAGVW